MASTANEFQQLPPDQSFQPVPPGAYAQPNDRAPVLLDPYLAKKPAPPTRRPFSTAAIVGACLSVLPLGSLAAIFFGIAGLRQTRLGTMRGRPFAIAAVALGGLLTVGYAVGSTVVVMQHLERERLKTVREDDKWAAKQKEREEEERARKDAEAAKTKTSTPLVPPEFLDPASPQGAVPQATRVAVIGKVPVVDIGVAEPSLSAAIAREMETAKKEDKEVMLMLVRSPCAPCQGVLRALSNPLMQDALERTRLVRVDVEVFRDDLAKLKYPTDRVPGFFLVRSDSMPRDGIDGGEWGEDIAANIAPVLRPFARGNFKKRKRDWKPIPMSGTFL